MPRRIEKKFHFIYKTTCLDTGFYYYGMHSTDDLDDGYLGGGKRLRYSIRKYGKENHKIERLEFFSSREELAKREEEIVNENEISKKECMNIIVGGEAFSTNEIHTKISSMGGKSTKSKIDSDLNFAKSFSQKSSETMKKLHKEGKIKIPDWAGRKHSKETKLRISKTVKEKKRKNNS